MKRVAAIALLMAGFAIPVFAQRIGGGHAGGGGGFAGHAGPTFHGGFSGPHFGAPHSPAHFSGGFSAARPYRFNSAPRYTRSYGRYPNSRYSRSRFGYRSGFRAPYRGERRRGDRDDRFHRRDFDGRLFDGRRQVFFYPVPDWLGLGPVGCYPDAEVYGDDYDDSGCDDLTADTDEPNVYNGDDEGEPPAPPPDYEQQSPPGYEQQRRPEYQPPVQSAPSSANQIATTIVFNDGRPSQQIHNYALTRTTLYVLDQRHWDIPLDQINLAATEKVNRAEGIDFKVPQ